MHHRSKLTLLTLFTLSACAEPSEPALGRTEQPIIGGSASTAAQDATVMIVSNKEFECTGTLIAPNLVLTARHCVSDIPEDDSECGVVTSDLAADKFTITVGLNANEKSAAAAKGSKLYLPSVKTVWCGNDIALIKLDRGVPNAKTAAVRFTPLTVGETTVAVGYGDTDEKGTLARTRQQRANVKVLALGPASNTWKTKDGKSLDVDVSAGTFETTESTCFGDSGGPLFDTKGQVVGVTSEGIDEDCIDRPTLWTALPQHEQLIRRALEEAGGATDSPDSQGSTSTTQKTELPDDESDDDEASSSKKKAKVTQPETATCSAHAGASVPSPFGALFLAAFYIVRRAGRRRRS